MIAGKIWVKEGGILFLSYLLDPLSKIYLSTLYFEIGGAPHEKADQHANGGIADIDAGGYRLGRERSGGAAGQT